MAYNLVKLTASNAFVIKILDFRQAMCWTSVIGWKLDVHCTVKYVRQTQIGWPLVHCSLALAGCWCTASFFGWLLVHFSLALAGRWCTAILHWLAAGALPS
jgi:hypothetical protein